MSTIWMKMWQEGVMMAGLNVGDVIRELDISRSYLYKLISLYKFLTTYI